MAQLGQQGFPGLRKVSDGAVIAQPSSHQGVRGHTLPHPMIRHTPFSDERQAITRICRETACQAAAIQARTHIGPHEIDKFVLGRLGREGGEGMGEGEARS